MPRGNPNATGTAPKKDLAHLHALAEMLAIVLEESNDESGGFPPLCIDRVHGLLFGTFIPKTAGFSDTPHLRFAELERCVEDALAGGPTHSMEPREPAGTLARRLVAAMFDLGSKSLKELAPEYFRKQALKPKTSTKTKASPATRSPKPKAKPKQASKTKAPAADKQLGLDVGKPKRTRKASSSTSNGISHATNPGAA